jgi:TonB family protein
MRQLSAQETETEINPQAVSEGCQLIDANPEGFKPFQFVPKKVDFSKLNYSPKVEWIVNEEGKVEEVNILKGTGSINVDKGLIKSIKAWKYKPQPGCKFEVSMDVVIDMETPDSE